ncbi:MAG: hypothetical protein ACR2IE_07925 [Candidatus Sumerlaeaceae bacterium]
MGVSQTIVVFGAGLGWLMGTLGVAQPMVRPAAAPVNLRGQVGGKTMLQPGPASSSAVPRTSTATSSFRNPGFEQVDAFGNPVDWNIFREAYADNNAAVAHTGSSSVRSSFLFGWSQTVLPPCSPYETFAVAGYARSEFKFEMPYVRCACFNSSGAHLGDIGDVFTNDAPDEYRLFWTALEPPRGAGSMEVYFGAASAQSWMRYDDITLYTEQIRSGADEPGDPWELINGASELSGDISLPQGASVTQRVASSKRDQTYFVAGRYSAPASASIKITDVWLPPAYWVTTATLEQLLSVSPGTGEFVTEMIRPNTFCYGQSKVGFEATTGSITLRDLKRGFARVDPTTFTVGPASPDPALFLTAAIPRKLASAIVEIRDSTGSLLATPPVELLGTAIRAEWKPTSAPAGQSAARFILTCSDGQVIQVERGFEVVVETVISEIPPLSRSSFTRGAWLFFFNNPGTTGIAESFALAQQDGFNYVMALCRTDQLPAVRAAAEQYGMPFIPQTLEVRSLFGEYLGLDYFSKADYVARVRQLLAAVLTSPMYEGVYVVDEPGGTAAQALNRRASLSIAQTADLRLPFAVLPALTDAASLNDLKPPVGMVDPYPFHSGNRDNSSWVTLEVSTLNSQVHTLAALGRDVWLVPQAFEANDFEYFRGVPNTEHSAQLGVAVVAGAKGVMPFTYSDGMRNAALQELPKLAPYRAFNNLMDRIGPLLMELGAPDLDTRAAAPLAVSMAQRAPGDKYVLALNAHDRSTYTLELQFSPAVSGPLDDVVAQRQLPLLPGGAVQLQLGPGDWAVIPCGNRVIDSFTTSSTAVPALSTIPLQITHQFTVQDGAGNPLVPRALDFNDAGDRVAVSVPFSHIPLQPRVYQLNTDGSVTRQVGAARFPAGQSFFMGNRLVESTENLGARIYAESAMDDAPVATFIGQSGGVYDLAPAGNSLWAATFGYGIRRLADGSGALSGLEYGLPQSDYYTDVLTIPDSIDAWVGIRNTGVDRVAAGQLSEELHQRAAIQQGHEGMAFNGVDLVAVPRGPKGADLVRVTSGNAPQWIATVARDAIDVAAVTWVYHDTLAVADSVYNVKFYRMYSNGTSSFLGSWRPDETSAFLFRCLEGKDGKLAVGLQDGRVFVLNTNVGILKTAASNWQLLE